MYELNSMDMMAGAAYQDVCIYEAITASTSAHMLMIMMWVMGMCCNVDAAVLLYVVHLPWGMIL